MFSLLVNHWYDHGRIPAMQLDYFSTSNACNQYSQASQKAKSSIFYIKSLYICKNIGGLRYSLPNTLTIALENRFNDVEVDSPTARYSPHISVHPPKHISRRDAMIFWWGLNPRQPKPSCFWTKY